MIKLTKIRLKCGYENYTELIPHRILFINRNLSICHLESIDYFQSDSSCGEAKGIGIHNSWFPRGGCGLCLPVFMSVCLSVCVCVSFLDTLLQTVGWSLEAEGRAAAAGPAATTDTDAVFVLADSARVARRPSPGIWAYGTSSALLYSTWKLYSWWWVWIEMGNIPYYGDFEGQYLGM